MKEALSVIYWFKSDLRSFLAQVLDDPGLLAPYDWEANYKRAIVSELIGYMAERQPKYRAELVRLIEEVCDLTDFTHLHRAEDGKAKEMAARTAVEALRRQAAGHFELVEEARQRRQHREETRQADEGRKAMADRLDALRNSYLELAIGEHLTPQQRGFALEPFLRELFDLFDLDPKASFRIEGEQVDGAFTFESTDYLLSAKWQKEPVGIEDLDAFKGKVDRKLENTLGLFVSIAGFSPTAVEKHRAARPAMFLMDGLDLMAVLEGRIDLVELLRRKRRHASQTGEPLLPVSKIL